MPLSNEQYNMIMHVYDNRRAEREDIITERRNELYSKVDGLKALTDEIAETAVSRVRRRIYDEGGADDLAIRFKELKDKMNELIKAAGYKEDYLDVPYVCPDCKDTGYIDGKRCHCLEQMSLKLLYDNSSMDAKNVTFDDFDLSWYPKEIMDNKTDMTSYDTAKKALKIAKDFTADFDSDKFKNMLIYGKPGIGKTHLANCISHELINTGHSVVYMTPFELFSVMKREAFSKNIYPRADYLRLFSCDLLIIDDLGTEMTNSMTLAELFELLNERINSKKSTLISTNLDLAGIKDIYTERLFSRIMEFYTLVPLIGRDIRIQKKIGG